MNRLFLFAYFLAFSLFASEIKFVKGQVLVNNKPATKGSKLNDKDVIKVESKSLAIIELDDKSKIKINENTELKVENAKKETPTTASLISGSAFFKIRKALNEKLQKEKFKVKTRQVSLGVRGTEFFVSYGKNPKEDVWMCVNEGLVEAKSRKTKALVKAGEGIGVKKDKMSPPKPLAWTKKLNWSMDENSGNLENNVSIEEAYTDLLGRDYD